MNKVIYKNTSGIPALWFWGWLYFWLVAHWSFWDAFWWIYVLIQKHLV